MIRPGKIVRASTIEDIPERKLTVKDKVFVLLSQNEYTTNEIALKLNISDRMIREAIMQLKRVYNIKETRCRCGHSPIYTVKK